MIAGIGYLAEHCDDWSFHGVKDGKESYDHHAYCNAGKGPLFRDFRNFMISNLMTKNMFKATPRAPCEHGGKAQV
jgi:hypothetical protein